MRRNNSKGGMQTSGVRGGILCPACGKFAARVETHRDKMRYMHFTKKGCVWHVVVSEGPEGVERDAEVEKFSKEKEKGAGRLPHQFSVLPHSTQS